MFRLYSTTKDLLRSPLFWCSVVAAFLYSSWPWAFLLDPSVGRHSLASELEAPHHPYNWFFIGMDVMTGLVLALIGAWQLRRHANRVPRSVIWSYMSFGVLVAVAALTPLVCDPTAQSCGPILHNYRILIHGIASIASVVFLLASLLGVAIHARRQRANLYVAAGLGGLLMAWLFFGVGSLLEMLNHAHSDNTLQYFFITICSVSIVAVVSRIELHAFESVNEESKLQF